MNEKSTLNQHESDSYPKTIDTYAQERRAETKDAEAALLDKDKTQRQSDLSQCHVARIRKTDLIRDAQLFGILDEYGVASHFEAVESERETDETKVDITVQNGAEQLTDDILQKYYRSGMRSFTIVTFLSGPTSSEIAEDDWFPIFGRELDYANEIPGVDSVPEPERLAYQIEMSKRQAMTNMTGYYAHKPDVTKMTPREIGVYQGQRDIFSRLQKQGLEPFSIDEMAQLVRDEVREFIDRNDDIKTRLEFFRDNNRDAEYVTPKPPEPEVVPDNVIPFQKRER